MNQLINLFKDSFGDCKSLAECAVKTSYELINSTNFFITDNDDNSPVKVVNENDVHQLKVNNSNQSNICLVKTDKCLFTDAHKKCDCILFNSEKFFLVEISSVSVGNRANKRKSAIVQFEETIGVLIQKNITFPRYSKKAVICFKAGKSYPIQTSLCSKRAEFISKYNVSLEEGNEIIF